MSPTQESLVRELSAVEPIKRNDLNIKKPYIAAKLANIAAIEDLAVLA